MARLYPTEQFFDDSGEVLNGGKIYTYITGTSTNKATYKDKAEGTAHANPIVLDSDGRPPSGAIWLLDDAEYRFIIKTSADVTLMTMDNISGIISTASNINIPDGIGLSDANGNESLLLGTTASAVNHLKLSNAATGDGPVLESLGDDTNIDININTKGTGQLKVNGSAISGTMFQGYRYGLTMANDTDTDHDISIAAGVATDSSNTVLMNLSSAMVKRIDAGWAAGTNQGGLPSALALTAGTWYNVFLIQHADGTVDAGFDTDLAASSLLSDSGYTYYRRIGSVKTDASANIRQFIQFGDKFLWDVPEADLSSVAPGTSRIAETIVVPTGVRVWADVSIAAVDADSSQEMLFLASATDMTETAPTVNLFHAYSENAGTPNDSVASATLQVLTNTSAQFGIKVNASDANVTLKVVTHGWREVW